MEIGKYIGKFLLKNKYCSLPGLGVFELKKASATYNASQSEIESPSYVISFSPIGSIDDTFASFIASHENVSISNASNNIKEFCKIVKEEVFKTGSFEIEHLGRVINVNGKLGFKQSSDLDLSYAPVPAPVAEIKTATTTEAPIDYSYPPAPSSLARKKNKNGLKLALGGLAIVLLGGIGYFGYSYWQNHKEVSMETPEMEAPALHFDTTSAPQPVVNDSLTNATRSDSNTTPTNVDTAHSTPAVATVSPGKLYQVVLMATANEAAANARSKQLNNYGHQTQVVKRDSSFLVTINASHVSNDTTILVDSIRRVFSPKTKMYILR